MIAIRLDPADLAALTGGVLVLPDEIAEHDPADTSFLDEITAAMMRPIA